MRLLVDTNVFIDYFVDRAGSDESKDFFRSALKYGDEIVVTSMSLRDIEYITHKITHNKEMSKNILIAIFEMVSKVIGISADDSINAIYSNVSDYEDAIQVEAAKSNNVDMIITNDLKDYDKSSIHALTPKDYNDIRKRSHLAEDE